MSPHAAPVGHIVGWTYAKLVAVAVIWGGTFVGGRVAVETMDPWSAAFLRFAFASLCLIVATVALEGGLPKLGMRTLVGVILLGLTGIITYNIFFFAGLSRMPAGRAALIIALNPVMVAVASGAFLGYRLRAMQIGGIMLSLLGAVIVITRGDPLSALIMPFGTGEFCILGCVASWVGYTLLNRWVVRDLTPLAAITYACLLGTIGLGVLAVHGGMMFHLREFSAISWAGVSFLGILGTALAFVWYAQGIAAIGPERAAIFLNLVPVSGVLLAMLLLGEPLSWDVFSGGALVVSGVVLTTRQPVIR